MSVVFTDNFNRADENPITGWVASGSADSFKIVSNAAAPTSDGNDIQQEPVSVTWPNNQYAQVKVTCTGGVGTGAGGGVFVRGNRGATTINKEYRCTVSKAVSNNFTVTKHVNGSPTVLAQTTVTWVDGDLMKLSVDGVNPGVVRAYQNGVQIGSDITDSSINIGAAGISYSTSMTSVSLDDFEGGGEFTTGYLRPNKLRPRPFAPCLAR